MNEENEQKKKPGLFEMDKKKEQKERRFKRIRLVIGLICVALGVVEVIVTVTIYHKNDKDPKSQPRATVVLTENITKIRGKVICHNASRITRNDLHKPSGQASPKQPPGTEQMDKENEQNKKPRHYERTKIVIGLICVVLGVAAVTAIVLEYHKNEIDPKSQPGCILMSTRTRRGRIKFGDPLIIECEGNSAIHQISINFSSTYNYIIRTEVNYISNVTNISEMSGPWMIDFSNTTTVLVRKSVKCDSDGKFTITVRNEENTYRSDINVEIESKVSQVKLEVGRSDTTGDLYNVSCSTGSQCTPTSVMVLGKRGYQVVPLYGVTFTCTMNYNDENGWSVTCIGSIPADIMRFLNSIVCRPDMKDQGVVKNTEAAVSEDSFY